MKFAVCDDEQIVTEKMCSLIKKYNSVADISVFHDGKALLESECDFDIIFLDIIMPETDGVEVAKALRKRGCDAVIIFLSSYAERVFDTFKVNAFRFLVKPVEQEKFLEAMTEAEKLLICKSKVIVGKTGTGDEVRIVDISYVEGYSNETYIYTDDGIAHKCTSQLKELETVLLGYGFYRINRNYLISMEKITLFSGKDIVLNGKIKFEISRRNIHAFKKTYTDYIKMHSHII